MMCKPEVMGEMKNQLFKRLSPLLIVEGPCGEHEVTGMLRHAPLHATSFQG